MSRVERQVLAGQGFGMSQGGHTKGLASKRDVATIYVKKNGDKGAPGDVFAVRCLEVDVG